MIWVVVPWSGFAAECCLARLSPPMEPPGLPASNLNDRVAEHGEELRDLNGAGAPSSEIVLESRQSQPRLNDSDPSNDRRLAATDRHSIPTRNETQQYLQLTNSALDQDRRGCSLP